MNNNIQELKHTFGKLTTPVLFVIFNRPDTTQQVFDVIREAKPTRLFVAADGPRENRKDDVEKCRATRDIIKQVDWDCEVKTLFREKNLGCAIGVGDAITWFFENVEEGIIIEDDCIPHQTFFWFCQELLEKYRNDERIMLILGHNIQFKYTRTNYSYCFSSYPQLEGCWSTWKRTWAYINHSINLWPEIKNGNWLYDLFENTNAVKYWLDIFQGNLGKEFGYWDYKLVFALLIQNGLSIVPNINLITNIGYGRPDSTNTKYLTKYANMKNEAINFPLKHPPFVIRDSKYDKFIDEKRYFNTAYWTLRRTISKTKIGKVLRLLKKKFYK